MTRFFFHVRDQHGLIPDEEGADYPALADALEEARASARDLAKQYVDNCTFFADFRIDVADEGGAVLAVYPLNAICQFPLPASPLSRQDAVLEDAQRAHAAIKQGLAQERRQLDARDAAEDRRWMSEKAS